ncbi:MAG: DUF512 domain-containing protein [Deltaproteobacteria bacterium]|jgi:putative radical SAM enzyme (TIGR03279 family)|nr:DUF512 domain-containing protein [Deltaproteobacteria bacterium]MCW8892949.1 DUF512 domain-containing protein [Deltaproteobacteria bacterium]MCW9049910.1 DUF512 domain-containing protein [Deltaproteobacteria bacterium]
MLRIESIEPGSYAAEMGLEAGDRLLSINGQPIDDVLDYHLNIAAARVQLEILRQDDEVWDFDLEKQAEEDIGIDVEHPQPRQCQNQCLFCFVHQLPKGLRRTLYIKDEDYRFSYLYGSYITLTNLNETDLERIIEHRLSPLYISVHAIEQSVRETLLGVVPPEIAPLLLRLTTAGIELHCQVVLCPGINDAEVLSQTIEFLAGLMPQVLSLAVVPVGLTEHRGNLPELKKVSRKDAQVCLEQILSYQRKYLAEKGKRFVFPADEIYLLAEQEIPPFDEYESFPQIENGVGMIAQFRQQALEVLLEAEPVSVKKVTLVTGSSFVNELQTFVDRLSLRTGVEFDIVAVKNVFFGEDITVAGLLTGRDLMQQLAGKDLGDALLIPDVMLKEAEPIFLDDLRVSDLQVQLQVPVITIESSPWGLLEGLEHLGGDPVEIVHC